jgi:hypothetical protein
MEEMVNDSVDSALGDNEEEIEEEVDKVVSLQSLGKLLLLSFRMHPTRKIKEKMEATFDKRRTCRGNII